MSINSSPYPLNSLHPRLTFTPDEPRRRNYSILIEEAQAARNHTHAPYSGFLVGAALLCDDGTIFRGCNVEISAYCLTCYAERTAVFSAVAAGQKSFRAIAVVADGRNVPPCGMCRQVLADFNPSMDIILVSSDGSHRVESLAELFPKPFSPKFLHGSNPREKFP